jgi:hypothetical protein
MDDAIWFASRAAEFNLRAFGARHRSTLLALKHLESLRDYAQTMAVAEDAQAA